MKIVYPNGATPLDKDELLDLIPIHLTTQEELNAWEEQNIIIAYQWAIKQKNIITLEFIKKLHKHMFDKTWKWAGKFRHTEKNIGINWHLIPVQVKQLCDNVIYQLENQVYSKDEVAIRFHHKLVWIHPFSNRNGRHARLIADLLITREHQPRFTWGMNQNLVKSSPIRDQYIASLKEADHGNFKKLIEFARS